MGIVIARVNLLAYVPLFFFAAALIFVGIALMTEWLLDVRHKLELREYCILLATFGAIQVVGLNQGIIVGIIGAGLNFLHSYANQV